MDDEPIDDGWWQLMESIDRDHEAEFGTFTRAEIAEARQDGLVLLLGRPK